MELRAVIASALVLAPTLAFAQPAIRAESDFAVPRIVLEGAWTGARYTVWRADAAAGATQRVGADLALCTGDCYVHDPTALPGGTYWYRFDLVLPDGTLRTVGPTPVAIGQPVAAGLSVELSPNPMRGAARIRLGAAAPPAGLAGTRPVGGTGEAGVYDASGRLVRTLFRGPLDRLRWEARWDGRDDAGATVRAGVYFVRFRGGGTSRTERLIVAR